MCCLSCISHTSAEKQKLKRELMAPVFPALMGWLCTLLETDIDLGPKCFSGPVSPGTPSSVTSPGLDGPSRLPPIPPALCTLTCWLFTLWRRLCDCPAGTCEECGLLRKTLFSVRVAEDTRPRGSVTLSKPSSSLTVSYRFSCCDNTNKSNLGRQGFISAYNSRVHTLSIARGSQCKNWRLIL